MLGAVNVPVRTLRTPTSSPRSRVSAVAVLVSALSFTESVPFQVTIAALFTSPLRLALGTPNGSAGSFCP